MRDRSSRRGTHAETRAERRAEDSPSQSRRDRDRESEAERQRDRDRETERQRQRDRERERERETERASEREREGPVLEVVCTRALTTDAIKPLATRSRERRPSRMEGGRERERGSLRAFL